MTKLVYGIGIYENGQYPSWVERKQSKEYVLWTCMLSRCMPGGREQRNYPSYIGCTVHPDFIKFQDFAEWCQHQIGFGNVNWDLDKDVLIQNNKVYGPDTCAFIPQSLNTLFNKHVSRRGVYPTGVCYCKPRRKYQANISINGISKTIGRFETPEIAEQAYKSAKLAEIRRQAEFWKSEIDPRVYESLLVYEI